MGKRVKIAVGAIAAAAVVAAAAVGAGRIAFERRVDGEIADLFAASAAAEPSILTEADLAGLPAPVQRWLRYARVVGRERPTTVRLKMEGQFRLGEDQGWMPF